MLSKEVPFLRIGLPFCAGIISGLYLKSAPAFIYILAGLAIAGFFVAVKFNKYLINILYGVSLNIALSVLGFLLCKSEMSHLSDLQNQPEKYVCTVTEFPEEKPKTFSIPLKMHGIIADQSVKPVNGSILVYLRKDSVQCDLTPGDILVISLKPVQIANRGNPDEFDYRLYMQERDMRYYSLANKNDILSVTHPGHIKLRYKALIIREKIIDMYRTRGISGEKLALVAAITLGQKNMLDRDQKQIFMKAGIMHIMAVSGLHAVILSLFIFKILFFLKGRLSNIRAVITLLILWLFAYVTGLSPSVLRATIMFSFLTAGDLLHRKPNNINSVLASAFVLLLGKPLVLFNAGFLLSYSAVLFIICFYQDLYSKLGFRNWLSDKIWQSAAVTITAQAGTLPLTISLFNRFPTWFLLTNIVIVPLSSLLIILGCIIPITYPVRFISGHVASLLGLLTGATQFLTEKASLMPMATIENIGLQPLQSFLLFITIFQLLKYLLTRQSIPVILPLLTLIVSGITGIIGDCSALRNSELIVYNTPGSLNIGICKGKSLQLVTDTSSIVPEIARHSACNGMKIKVTRIDSKGIFFRAKENGILVTTILNNKILKALKPDFVILYGKFPSVERPLHFIKPTRQIVVTGGIKSSLIILDPSEGGKEINIHYIWKSGAFIIHL